MDPNTIPAENWTDLLGAVFVGPISHGLIVLLGAIKRTDDSGGKVPFFNEDLLKGLGIGLCFGMIWLFSKIFDPAMTPKAMLMAGAAAWGIASGTKLAQAIVTPKKTDG